MAKYKAPKVRLHRDFFYLNDVVSINLLSALESGKVDELAVRHSGGQVRSDVESAQVRVLRARCSLHGTQPIAFPTESLDKPEDPLDVAGCPARWVDLAVERHTGTGYLNEWHQRGL